jgi:hypothetical protein
VPDLLSSLASRSVWVQTFEAAIAIKLIVSKHEMWKEEFLSFIEAHLALPGAVTAPSLFCLPYKNLIFKIQRSVH